MYKCNKCGAVFEEPMDGRKIFDTGRIPRVCPDCESTDYKPVGICRACEDEIVEDQRYCYCDKCFDKLEEDLRTIRYEHGITEGELENMIEEFYQRKEDKEWE